MKSLRIAVLACIAAVPMGAQAADGQKLYDKHCKKCHSLEAGKHGLGPSLAGIFGLQAGTQNFDKYKALVGSSIVWDETNMSSWIEDPKGFIGKTTTMVVKVKKAEERQAIIDYLKAN